MKIVSVLSMCAVAAFAAGSVGASEATPLFDGITLDGWVQKNGTATFEVVDGTIVGTTAEGSPNSFLCTEREYGDFDLRFEVKLIDSELNSGVMIRSQTENGERNGRVNGPQVEIEASGEKGGEAGYIYGESIGGWLTPKERLIPHTHFRDGQWNRYRIVAKGPRIRVWINDQLIEDLTDEKVHRSHPSGFIGLQVHSIGEGQGPWQVAWRNLTIEEL